MICACDGSMVLCVATPKQDHSDIASRGGSGLMSNPRVLALVGTEAAEGRL